MSIPHLVYRNTRPELLAWREDVQARLRACGDARDAFLDRFCTEHGGPPQGERGTFSRGTECTGVAWPQDTPVPKGWRRPADDPRLIRPHLSTRIGKAAQLELDQLRWPDVQEELSRLHGMRSWAAPPMTGRYYTPGVRLEEDAVWATWGTQDVAADVEPDATGHGWERVSLVEYLQRFGEGDSTTS